MNRMIYVVMLALLCACSSQTETEKHQVARNKVVEVKDKIKEIDTDDDVLIGRLSSAYYSKDYLIVTDYDAWEGAIHLFDKKDFRYLTSTGKKGEGPYELTNAGGLMIDEFRRKLYMIDYSKYKVFSYDMDSIITMPDTYRHQVKTRIGHELIPDRPFYVSDTLCYGRIIQPTSVSTFDMMVGKWNLLTGEIKVIGEKHPDVKRKRVLMDVSMEKKMMVEVYGEYDLMGISDLDGRIQCYIYGPDWPTEGLKTFGGVMITSRHILAVYSGDVRTKGRADKIHVFDLEGNYLRTIGLGYNMTGCAYDNTHHRLFMIFDDEIQFGYLDLDGIV